MIRMYCNHNHDKNGALCNACNELSEFANERINRCIYGDNKPVCSECQIHCYRLDMRERIKTVMRFSGPRMIYRHPIMGIRHLIDKHRYKHIDVKTLKSKTSNQ